MWCDACISQGYGGNHFAIHKWINSTPCKPKLNIILYVNYISKAGAGDKNPWNRSWLLFCSRILTSNPSGSPSGCSIQFTAFRNISRIYSLLSPSTTTTWHHHHVHQDYFTRLLTSTLLFLLSTVYSQHASQFLKRKSDRVTPLLKTLKGFLYLRVKAEVFPRACKALYTIHLAQFMFLLLPFP